MSYKKLYSKIISLQPINEFVEFINNQQQLDSKNNYHETNPQTPSSIPEIILTGGKFVLPRLRDYKDKCSGYFAADDGSDQALQRMLGINNDNLDCFLDGDLKEGLGKLDDNMMRLVDYFGNCYVHTKLSTFHF